MAAARRRVSYSDVRLLAAAAATMMAVRVGLWMLPFRFVRGAVVRAATPARYFPKTARPVDRVVWAVMVASRFTPRASCLTQSFTAQVLLRRHGHPAELRLGIARDRGELDAHAWVESEGRVVIGNAELWRYSPLVSLSDR
jgi:hypothetical protein